MPFTTSTAQKIINKILRNTDFAHPAALYVSLHTADPGETGANEVAPGGYTYTRQAVNFDAPAGKATQNSALLEWLNMPAVTITHLGLWDASSAGNFWWGGPFSSQVPLSAGNTFQIKLADLDIALT